MRKLFLLGVAMVSLGAAAPALAQSTDDAQAAVGATAGGATGGTIGFLLGGPIGAIVGGFAGAVIGGEAAVSEDSIRYAGENPVDVVYLDSDLSVGSQLDSEIEVYSIEGDQQYGYVYANSRVYIVNLEDRTIVQSPGYIVPNDAVTYVEANPTASISIDGDVTAGFQIDADVQLSDVPDRRNYKYVYINDRPALIDAQTRTVIWVR